MKLAIEITSTFIRSLYIELDAVIDFSHGGISKDLGVIADAMYEWEGQIADALGLTKEDVDGILRI